MRGMALCMDYKMKMNLFQFAGIDEGDDDEEEEGIEEEKDEKE